MVPALLLKRLSHNTQKALKITPAIQAFNKLSKTILSYTSNWCTVAHTRDSTGSPTPTCLHNSNNLTPAETTPVKQAN